ncbi:unnamed protein product [marine sediment metagenome]|uniref:Uncharacterized protein n=1 Tax=marine sediment metagenome TaxID=412755 RepID=X0SSF5_9ZZZZ
MKKLNIHRIYSNLLKGNKKMPRKMKKQCKKIKVGSIEYTYYSMKLEFLKIGTPKKIKRESKAMFDEGGRLLGIGTDTHHIDVLRYISSMPISVSWRANEPIMLPFLDVEAP